MTRTWSYSVLKDYETCPQRIKLKLLKAPVPDVPPIRGVEIHALAERFVRGELDRLPAELRRFEQEFEDERQMWVAGTIEVESEWGFTPDWEPVGWFDAWLRVKCDQVQHLENSLSIVDHKTGKSFGNEVPHLQQAQLYALAGFMRYPEINVIETVMRYLDEGKSTRKLWSRDKDCIRLLNQYRKRVSYLMDDRILKPKANRMNCRFCRYSTNDTGSGACAFAVPWETTT